MSLIYNGTTVQKIVYNNVDLDAVYYGSTLVWQKPAVYDGSKFGGIFKNGVISGPSVKAYGDTYGTKPIDQAAGGATYKTGAVTISNNFTQSRTNASTIYAGFATVDAINLTNISKININETIHYRIRNNNATYIKLRNIYYCTKSGTTYVSQGTLPSSGGPSSSGQGNTFYDSTGTTVFDCSGVTGSYYLYFNFTGWCEVYPANVNSKVNSITIA